MHTILGQGGLGFQRKDDHAKAVSSKPFETIRVYAHSSPDKAKTDSHIYLNISPGHTVNAFF